MLPVIAALRAFVVSLGRSRAVPQPGNRGLTESAHCRHAHRPPPAAPSHGVHVLGLACPAVAELTGRPGVRPASHGADVTAPALS
jgi:hypothetical protein